MRNRILNELVTPERALGCGKEIIVFGGKMGGDRISVPSRKRVIVDIFAEGKVFDLYLAVLRGNSDVSAKLS